MDDDPPEGVAYGIPPKGGIPSSWLKWSSKNPEKPLKVAKQCTILQFLRKTSSTAAGTISYERSTKRSESALTGSRKTAIMAIIVKYGISMNIT